MGEYIPTPGPLPGIRYMPGNGAEGAFFMSDWCCTCARDKAMREGANLDDCDDNEVCQIIAASFRDEAVEWRELDDGRCICVAYVPEGQPIPPPRCAATSDMFPPGDGSE